MTQVQSSVGRRKAFVAFGQQALCSPGSVRVTLVNHSRGNNKQSYTKLSERERDDEEAKRTMADQKFACVQPVLVVVVGKGCELTPLEWVGGH